MPHQPIRKPQPPPRLDILPLEEIELTAQVASSQQALHQLTQGLKQRKPKNIQRIYEAIEEENREKTKKKMSKVCDGAVPFNVMYYHVLLIELAKELMKQSKQVGKALQINIFYSDTQTVFIFTKKLKINGVLEVCYVFPLRSEPLMDGQLALLFTTFYRTKNFDG